MACATIEAYPLTTVFLKALILASSSATYARPSFETIVKGICTFTSVGLFSRAETSPLNLCILFFHFPLAYIAIVFVEASFSRVFSPFIPSVNEVLVLPIFFTVDDFPTSITVPFLAKNIIPFLEYFPNLISNFPTSKL